MVPSRNLASLRACHQAYMVQLQCFPYLLTLCDLPKCIVKYFIILGQVWLKWNFESDQWLQIWPLRTWKRQIACISPDCVIRSKYKALYALSKTIPPRLGFSKKLNRRKLTFFMNSQEHINNFKTIELARISADRGIRHSNLKLMMFFVEHFC